MKKSLLCICCVSVLVCVAQDNIETRYLDTDEPFRWIRLHGIDPFDDKEYSRGLTYYSAPEIERAVSLAWIPKEYDYSKLTLFSIYRDQDTDDSSCETFINIAVPAAGLSERHLKDTKLSFNFKRYKTITADRGIVEYSDPMEDLKFLNLTIERHNIWSGREEEPNHTRLYYATEMKKVLTAMLQSSEMRIRVQFGDTYFNLNVPLPRRTKFKDEYDEQARVMDRTITIVNEFEEKWTWTTELCEDPALDLDVDRAETTEN